MSRYQFDLDQIRKDCRERFGSTQSGTFTTCGKYIQHNLHHMENLVSHGARAAVVMPGHVVYGLEGHSSGLR